MKTSRTYLMDIVVIAFMATLRDCDEKKRKTLGFVRNPIETVVHIRAPAIRTSRAENLKLTQTAYTAIPPIPWLRVHGLLKKPLLINFFRVIDSLIDSHIQPSKLMVKNKKTRVGRFMPRTSVFRRLVHAGNILYHVLWFRSVPFRSVPFRSVPFRSVSTLLLNSAGIRQKIVSLTATILSASEMTQPSRQTGG
jgi:hypothetical protein